MHRGTQSLFVLAVAALALCACGSSPAPSGPGSRTASAAPARAGVSASVDARAPATPSASPDPVSAPVPQAFEPVTISDPQIGLTMVCDQLAPDFNAPVRPRAGLEYANQYTAGADGATSSTITLVHCVLDFADGSAYTDQTSGALGLLSDDDGATITFPVEASEELEAVGLEPVDSADDGSTHVEGWIPVARVGQDPAVPRTGLVLSYDREDDNEVYTSHEPVVLL